MKQFARFCCSTPYSVVRRRCYSDYQRPSGKRSWVKLAIPASFGVAVGSVSVWSTIRKDKKCIGCGEENVISDWEVLVYKSLPFRWMSRSFGKLTEVHLPTTLRYYIYSLYAFKTGVNKNEIPLELHDYETLMEFFTRALKPGVRPIASCDIVSPADGTMCHCGMVDNFEIEQVKNVRYSIKKFLGELNTKCEDINKNKIDLPPPYNLSEIPEDGTWEQYKKSILHNPDNELYQCVIYLSPGDYHRFHSPVDWKVNFRRHFCGELFSVNPVLTRWIPGLFAMNERVLYTGSWCHGFFSFTAVGATNVGSIVIYNDKNLQTNVNHIKVNDVLDEKCDFAWKKGEEIGKFRFGSTVVLIFEAPKNFKFPNVKKVQVGRSLEGEEVEEKSQEMQPEAAL
uniref:phosphatidylserine decarboxylase n=3 Tax=Lygus hesperus TaxID=30085 RepID=A0A0A9WXW8_LYGHE